MTAPAANSGPAVNGAAHAASGKGNAKAAAAGNAETTVTAAKYDPSGSGFNQLSAANAKTKDEASLAQALQVKAQQDYARIVKENAEDAAWGEAIGGLVKIGTRFLF